MAAVVPASDPANNLGNGGSTLKYNQNTKTKSMLKNKVSNLTADGCEVNGHILALQAVIFSQQLLVLFMGAELDGSIGDDSNHGGRVSPP